MNIGEHVCFQISVFAIFELAFLLFPDIPRSRVSGVYSSSIFSFWEPSICFPQWLHQFRFPPSVCTSVLFSPHPRQHGFLMIIILTDVRWYLWFWFAFTWWLAMLSIFSCVYGPSVFPLWKNAFSVLLPVFHSVLFSWRWGIWAIDICWILICYQSYHLQIFSLIQQVVFIL